jgi:hypothetical protein
LSDFPINRQPKTPIVGKLPLSDPPIFVDPRRESLYSEYSEETMRKEKAKENPFHGTDLEDTFRFFRNSIDREFLTQLLIAGWTFDELYAYALWVTEGKETH